MKQLIKYLTYLRRRFALSPLEEYVAIFVICVLAASLALRIWTRTLQPQHPPIPHDFSGIDSVFTARAAAMPGGMAVDPTADHDTTAIEQIFSSDKPPQKKTFPLPHSVNLNTATKESLEELPMVGPTMAERIVAFRENTPFRKIVELQRVKGIGKKKFARIEPYVNVE